MIKRLFHFFGSVHFAVTLIGFTALFVIVGTILESLTESHIFASKYTYNHPAFIILLGFFFVNILVSALRRYPFKARHIPFLITHLGLLMVLSGTMIKKIYGVQGSMLIKEGSGSHELILRDHPAVRIEKKGPEKTSGFFTITKGVSPFPELTVRTRGLEPHSETILEGWIKGDLGVISGLKPFKVHRWDLQPPPPLSGKIRMTQESGEPWNLYGLKVNDIEKALLKLYLENTTIAITDQLTGSMLYEGDLQKTIENKAFWDDTEAKISLNLNFSPETGFVNPELTAKITREKISTLKIPLSGPGSLLDQEHAAQDLRVDLHRTPSLALIQQNPKDTYLAAFDLYGRVWSKPFLTDKTHSIVVYDEGFGGYAVTAEIPFGNDILSSRKEKEECRLNFLKEALEKGVDNPKQLSPPLRLLFDACQLAHVSFEESLVDFLYAWDLSGKEILPKNFPLPEHVLKALLHIDWKGIPIEEFGDEASAFSACLKTFDIDLQTISPPVETLFSEQPSIMLETPLTQKHLKLPPTVKAEDNISRLHLSFRQGMRKDEIYLAYDRTATGLRWPILEGDYLVRYQPLTYPIPFHVRIRQGRQINYPGSNQPYSFECGLIITDRRNGNVLEKTLSMNRVFESWDGYRFYLANITPPDESSIKKVTLVINHDPGKYFLTYPGGLFVTLGIILLFWVKKIRS